RPRERYRLIPNSFGVQSRGDCRLDVFPRAAVALNASHRDGVGMLGSQIHRWWRRDAREGRLGMTIDRQPHRHLEPLQALQVAAAELGLKLSSEVVGVFLPALKDHSCPRIRG